MNLRNVRVSVQADLSVSGEEAEALNRFLGYGPDNIVKALKAGGCISGFIKPHEEQGLKDALSKLRTVCNALVNERDRAAEGLKGTEV